MNRDKRIWIEVDSNLVDYDQIESISREINGNARIATKSGCSLFTKYSYDSVIKEVKGVIRYYGDASHKLELIKDDKK